ncbi:NAD-dependent epimerase/dehydratase family protein [Prochlorococcus marinus XMU1410]|uniref:NAD-dependent epimerase/dehydratase family protein n=1 Tax=Prochlorococcus marinus TaxID=1219 RepID=UPI001AD9BCAC|nr:NAD-dependent epimerase/dehydratase family protein [Prochlorococcus marinus]MBO8242362.1 NAD-dependent epimerase/dehydratase family protein [Prochlorococcus marinus XMU1410]MBW3053509.1 protein CapI [Prochlorococcus marinus str. MU1410]
MSNYILVTGCAGFIGFHLCKRLIEDGNKVLGIDNINNYYDTNLKKKRLEILSQTSFEKNNWEFFKIDLLEKNLLLEIFEKYKPITVINFAAQAGVRYSLENPASYIDSNINGFFNILECCKLTKVKSLLYASSSSVYGGNTKVPYSENDSVNHPVSLYAATKRSNELMAHSYSHLYGIPCTGMRFFTVYGPFGRPDMAPMIFADAIINKKTLKIYNYGKMSRSFTYIDDVTNILVKLIKKPATRDEYFDTQKPNSSTSWCPNRILNIGNDNAIGLLTFINMLEKELGLEAIKDFDSLKKGDVVNTQSENINLNNWIGTYPKTSLSEGIKKFINWYKNYYK